MQNALRYLKWEITRKYARIIGCDKTFEGAMAIPGFIDGFPVVLISETAFYKRTGIEENRLRTDAKKTKNDVFRFFFFS